MHQDPRALRILVRSFALGILAVAACGGGSTGGCGGGGGGCLGCGEGDYEYPKDDPNRPDAIVQTEVARARITQGFIDFIRPQIPGIIKSALGSQQGLRVDANDVLHIDIPNTDLFDIGIAQARLRDGEALLWLDDLEQRMVLTFEEPNSVRFELNNLRLGVMMDIRENIAGTTSSCPLEGELGPGPVRHAAEISVNAVIDPGVGPDPDRMFDIRVEVDDIALNDLDVGIGDYCSEPECMDCALEVAGRCLDPGGRCAECNIFCGGVTDGLLSLVTALIDLVRPLLNNILQPVIANFVRSAVADFNNQPAALQMQVSLADLLGIDAFQGASPFGIFIGPEPGRFPVLDRGTGLGMEITTSGGAEAELADCVGALPDFNMPKGPVPVLGGTDRMGRPYHVGATLASSWINQILYSVHRSGSLCLKLGSQDIRALTGGAFSLNASVLSLLASDLTLLSEDAAPVILQLKPRNAPILDLGSGEIVGQDMDGNDIFDWLFKINVEDMGLAFHVLIQDRYVRIFEVTLDVNIGLNVMVLPDNSLEVAVGELRIDDFKEEFNEILPNADFAQILPTLIDLVLQTLISNQLNFNLDITNTLSDALGGAPVFLRINDIFRDGIQEDYLTLTMTFTSSPGASLSLAAETYARLDEQDGLHNEVEEGAFSPTGRVRLKVGELLDYTDQRALEYQVRVDRGLWRVARPARPDGTLYVADPHLMIPGDHEIEVRARYQGDYESLDATPAVLTALIDPTPPMLAATIRDDAVRIDVTDFESPGETLTVQGRLLENGVPGEWFDVALDAPIRQKNRAHGQMPLTSVGSANELELVATDAIGNRSKVAKLRVGLNEATEGTEQGCGCGVSRTKSSGLGLHESAALLLLAGLIAVRRRRS